MLKKNVSIIEKNDCSGCASCMNACMHNAIKMKSDDQGFFYPQVEDNTCIGCGLCVSVCPSQSVTNLKPLKTYAIKKINDEERLLSTSGGIASAIAENFICRGGTVYGVIQTSKGDVLTLRADNLKEIESFKGSKYVQTYIGYSFSECREDLLGGKVVAFFGTSCHIDGLLHYLKIRKTNISNLLTVDLICHGVPSPQLFKDYISFLNKRKPVERYECRTKKNGWGNGSQQFSPTIMYKDGVEECDTLLSRAWLNLFFSNCCLRPHCYSCPYAGKGRCADITIADYWGIKDVHPSFFDERGISLVISNTLKGDNLLSEISGVKVISSDYDSAVLKQNNAHSPSKMSARYYQFWNDYKNHNMEYILRHYTSYNYKQRILSFLKNII